MDITNFLESSEEKKKAIGLIHRVYVTQLKNSRSYNAYTKTKSEVRGGGRKPWKQKGTGRARAGSLRSPLFVGGGVSFGPKPKIVNKKINNLFYTGQLTVPGPGVPPSIISGKIVANELTNRLKNKYEMTF